MRMVENQRGQIGILKTLRKKSILWHYTSMGYIWDFWSFLGLLLGPIFGRC